MSLKENFRRTVADIWEGNRRKRWASLSDSEWWSAVKEEILDPALTEAAEALEELSLFTYRNGVNDGNGVRLEVGLHGEAERSFLTFKLHPGGINISSPGLLVKDDFWERPFVTDERLIALIIRFLEMIAHKYPQPPGLSCGIA